MVTRRADVAWQSRLRPSIQDLRYLTCSLPSATCNMASATAQGIHVPAVDVYNMQVQSDSMGEDAVGAHMKQGGTSVLL